MTLLGMLLAAAASAVITWGVMRAPEAADEAGDADLQALHERQRAAWQALQEALQDVERSELQVRESERQLREAYMHESSRRERVLRTQLQQVLEQNGE